MNSNERKLYKKWLRSSHYRDLQEFKRSLRILCKYIDQCNSGDYDYAMDIPTQIYKIFFDKNPRNDNKTLFERVCEHADINVMFHPLITLQIATVVDMPNLLQPNRSGSHGISYSYEEYLTKKVKAISFEEWKEHVVQIVFLSELKDEPPQLDSNNDEANIIDTNKPETILQLIVPHHIFLVQQYFIISAEILAQRGYTFKLSPEHEAIKQQMIAQSGNIELDKFTKLIRVNLSIENLFRTIRHKDSAHTDPLNQPKFEDEYDFLYAAKAFQLWDEETNSKRGYEDIVVNIADYIVKRVSDEMSHILSEDNHDQTHNP